jgi:hypothetical protein
MLVAGAATLALGALALAPSAPVMAQEDAPARHHFFVQIDNDN